MIMKYTKKQYQQYVEKKSPKSKLWRNICRAFLIGGIICVIGQLINNLYKSMGFDMDTVSAMTSITLVFIGVLLTALDIYDDLGKYAGAGSIVPITGFANSIASPAIEFKAEGFVLGVGAKMFIIAGPVLVYGISTSIIVGLIYYLIGGTL